MKRIAGAAISGALLVALASAPSMSSGSAERMRVATCHGKPVTVTLNDKDQPIGSGKDRVSDHATNGRDVINTGGGDDKVDSFGGNDLICGGDGEDLILGDVGNDKAYGGGGDDYSLGIQRSGLSNPPRVVGGPGDDELYGGDGRDAINGSAGDDNSYGEAGNDHFRPGDGDDFCDGGPGTDKPRDCEHTANIP